MQAQASPPQPKIKVLWRLFYNTFLAPPRGKKLRENAPVHKNSIEKLCLRIIVRSAVYAITNIIKLYSKQKGNFIKIACFFCLDEIVPPGKRGWNRKALE